VGDVADVVDEADEEERAKRPAAFTLAQFFLEHVEVRKQGLFHDAATRRLCSYQVVRLGRVDKTVRLANQAICEAVTHEMGEEEEHEEGEEESEDAATTGSLASRDSGPLARFPLTEALWLDLCRKGDYPWFHLDGAAVVLDLPADPDEATLMRRLFVEEALFPALVEIAEGKVELSSATLAQASDFFSNHLLGIVQKTDGFRFIWGDPDGETNQLVPPFSAERAESYTNNLLEWAAEQEFWVGTQESAAVIHNFRAAPARVFRHLPVPQARQKPPDEP